MILRSEAMSPIRRVRRTSFEPHLGQRGTQIGESVKPGSQSHIFREVTAQLGSVLS